MAPYVYRVTPYDPADRDERDRPRGLRQRFDELDGVVDACCGAVEGFVEAIGPVPFIIDNPMLDGFAHYSWHAGVEDRGLAGLFPPDHTGYHDGARVSQDVAVGLVRAMLRRLGVWCRLRTDTGFFVHVGDELDVYIGGDDPCPGAVELARARGLCVERIDRSPYDPGGDEVESYNPADDAFWAAVAALTAARGRVLLEETYVRNGSRWHHLTLADIRTVRAGIAPRARLAVWPDLTGDTAALRRADSHHPLLAAVLPDPDGVVRARWRTNPTRADERRSYLRELRRGEIRGGVVTATPAFGAFVELDGHRGHCLGFINVPELSWLNFAAITDVVEVGQRISVAVLGVDLWREQAALSLRATQPDPWRLYAETVRNGQIVPGTVTMLVPFGAFVRIQEGIEGLVHIRELTDRAVETPDQVVREGDEVDVVVIGIDLERRRISLSRKQAIGPDTP